MESEKSFVDVQEVVNEIRARVRARMGTQAARSPELDIDAARVPVSSLDLTSLHHAAHRTRAAQALVGQMPPQPPGVRARVGAAIVGIVRRMLFWYTPQIHEFQRAAAQAIEEQESIASSLGRELAVVAQALQSLQASVSALRQETQTLQSLRGSVSALQSDIAQVRTSIQQETQTLQSLHRSVSGLERDIAQVRTATLEDVQQIVEPIRTEFGRLADERSCLSERISRLEDAPVASGSPGRPSDLETKIHAGEARVRGVERRMDEVVAFAGDRIADLRTKLELQSRRIGVLLEGNRPGAMPREDAKDARGIDALYARFEDIFRGARDDIKERMGIYVPLLSEAGIRGPEMPVLDIGCGRGEWLEVLRENGIQCRGVDINSAMVARCEVRGLPVAQADGVDYLKNLPPDSLGAVTAFHVLEHLSFEKLLDLFDETSRVLKPGGIAIFETPNPDNLLVGACTFYTDPTHRNPLPQQLLHFLAEARGFSSAEVMALHPYPEDVLLNGHTGAVGARLNELLYGPQDYAVIARK